MHGEGLEGEGDHEGKRGREREREREEREKRISILICTQTDRQFPLLFFLFLSSRLAFFAPPLSGFLCAVPSPNPIPSHPSHPLLPLPLVRLLITRPYNLAPLFFLFLFFFFSRALLLPSRTGSHCHSSISAILFPTPNVPARPSPLLSRLLPLCLFCLLSNTQTHLRTHSLGPSFAFFIYPI